MNLRQEADKACDTWLYGPAEDLEPGEDLLVVETLHDTPKGTARYGFTEGYPAGFAAASK
jgi:hypothetical protein